MFDGDRDLPVPTSGNWVIKGCMTRRLRLLRFYVFLKIPKTWLITFFERLHRPTFSRTLVLLDNQSSLRLRTCENMITDGDTSNICFANINSLFTNYTVNFTWQLSDVTVGFLRGHFLFDKIVGSFYKIYKVRTYKTRCGGLCKCICFKFLRDVSAKN